LGGPWWDNYGNIAYPAFEVGVESPGRPAKQGLIAERGAKIGAQILAAQEVLTNAGNLKCVATRLAKVRGNDSYLPYVSRLDDEDIAGSKMNPRTFTMPSVVYEETTSSEVDPPVLDVEGLDVHDTFISEDVTGRSDIAVCKLAEDLRQVHYAPVGWQTN